MKEQLKYIDVNGYGILVDESAELDGYYFDEYINKIKHTSGAEYEKADFMNKIIFAEKELNLDVPILPNWREWEVEQMAFKSWEAQIKYDTQVYKRSYTKGYIESYNHNKAKYTEEDLEQMFMIGLNCSQEINMKDMTKEDALNYQSNKLYKAIQSLQKVPKFIVMKDERIEEIERDHDEDVNGDNAFKHKSWQQRLKLITNSEGKQEGIIKEIIF
jgi:hypothetical protein